MNNHVKLLVLSLILVMGCAEKSGESGADEDVVDTGTNTAADRNADTVADTEQGVDADPDAGTDTSTDVDTGSITGIDTAVDTGSITGIDTAGDTGSVTGIDTAGDTGSVTGIDTAGDTGSDIDNDMGTIIVGGDGVTLAGALPHSCETPNGFTRVDTLEKMIGYLDDDDVNVALAPGTYAVGPDDVDLFTEVPLPKDQTGHVLLHVSGNNSVYDFSCVRIEFDTQLWREFGKDEVMELRFVGNGNTVRNLTIEDIGWSSPTGGALGFVMDGKDNLIEGCHLTLRGSQPYGLGDAYGKGAGPVLSHQKHSGVLIRGLRNTFKQSTVINRSYGHSVFMQGSEDTLIDGIYVEGELRSTDDMLAADNPRFAQADARAASVDFITVWGYKLPSGYWMSLQEAGIRAYNSGSTVIDGEIITDKGAENVTVLNSVIKNTRTGVTLAHAKGNRYVENVTLIGCEQGFSIGTGQIVNSYADANVGPVLTFAYDSDSGTIADITVLPTDGSKNGWGALAYIGGKNHKITLRSSQTNIPSNLNIVVSGDKTSIRHLYDSLANQDWLTVRNTEINNLTNFPMVLNDLAEGVTGQSNGPVTGNIVDNDVIQN